MLFLRYNQRMIMKKACIIMRAKVKILSLFVLLLCCGTQAWADTFFGWYVEDADGRKRYISYEENGGVAPAYPGDEAVFGDADYSSGYGLTMTVTADYIAEDGRAIFHTKDMLLPDGSTLYRDYDLTQVSGILSEGNGGTLILEADGALYGEHYLSRGTRVLIPYNDEETWIDPHNPEYQFRPGGSTDLNCYQYRTLTTMAGSKLTVGESAELEVAGQQLAAGAPLTTGGPFNACGCINMKNGGEIVVEHDAGLYCLGAIIGQNMLEGNNTREVGSITVKNGGTVCEYFVIGDWRGGTRTSQLIGQMWRRIFPFCSYYIQGIEVPMTLEYGAREFVRSLLSDSSGSIIVPSEFGIIGTGNAMFLMTDAGSSVKKWYDATTDHTCIELIGTAKLSHLELSMMDIDVSSENFVLPIPCGMRILLKNCNMNLSNEINILPGAILEIEEDANVTVTNNIFVWDMDQWEKFAYNRYFYTMDYTLTPHYKRDGNNKSTMGDGRIVVDGTLTLDGTLNSKGQRKGNLYTSLSGADVMGNGGGRLIINGTAEMPDTAAHQVTSTQNDWRRVPMYPVKLHNDNDSYTATAVNNTYKNLTTRWFHNDVTENADHTWNFTYLNPTVDATSKSVYTINTIGRGWWSNVEEDTKVNTFHKEGATDPYYNYTVNGAWLQLDRTETDGLYSGSDNKLYSYLDNVWTTSYEIDANCLYDFGGTKKARVGENFVEIAKNSNDEAYHNVANASQYYLQFEGCDWREATKVADKEKAYSVSGQVYIWASIDGKPLEWLAVTVSGNYYTAKNEQNVNVYYEWDAEAGRWDTPKPLFRVTDATGYKEFAVLEEALMYVNSLRNPTFTLLADVTDKLLSFTSALMSNTITLDLNGHKITGTTSDYKKLIKLDAEFTNLIITDNAGGGSIVSKTTQAIYVNAGTVTIAVPVQGTYQVVYVEGVGIANIVEGAAIKATSSTKADGTTRAAIYVVGRLNVMGGTITAASFAIDATSALSASHNSTSGLEAVTKDFQHAVTISGGTITSNGTTREAIYMQGGPLVMTGGTLTSKAVGIRGEYKHAQLSATYGNKILATRYSTIDIRGGHITAVGKGICSTDTMRVSAGNINVSGTDSVFGVAPVKIPAWPRRMEITGGTISATCTGHTVCGVFLSSDSQGSKITGGTITASGNEDVYGVYLLSPNEYEVSDATITATATSEAAYGVYAYYPYASLKGNLNVSATAPGDAYAVFVETMPGDKDELDYPSVSIYDGTYTSAITDGSTAYAVYAQEHFQDLKLVVIYGGKFRCTKNGEIADELFYEGTHPAIFAQGGYFATPYCECPDNTIVFDELPKYVAAGYPIGAEEVTSGPEFEAGYRTHLTTMFTAYVYDKDGNLLSEHHLRAGEAPVQEAPFVLNYRFKGWRDNKGRLWSELPPCDVASTPAVVTYTAEYEQAICELEIDGETEYYMSVSAAWTEAIKHKTATVRLLQSVTLDNPRLSCNNTGIADQYITFDMNGCTFTSTSGRVFSNIRGTSLTLEFTDSKGGGRIYEKGTNSYILYNECDTKNKATIIVNGGTLQGDYRIFYFCDKEHFIINDGELKVSTSSSNNFIFFPINHAQGARVTINGGELTFREKCFYYWYETITQCSGGYYTASTLYYKNPTNYTIFNQHLAPGCAVHTLNSAEPAYARGMRYQVFKTADAEAQIGSKLYPTFHQAYLAATSGQTITLLKDVSGWDGQHDFNKSVTIDLNGHTLNGSNAHAWMNLGSSITVTVTSSVEGGRLVAELPAGSESNQYPRVLNVTNSNGVLNLNNISIEFTTPESSYQAMGMVVAGTSAINMTNCHYTIGGGPCTNMSGIVEQGSGAVVIDGCTIRGANDSQINLIYPQVTSTLTVRNTDMLVQAGNGQPARCVLNNATTTIESGTFRAESSEWTVTIWNSTGTCTVLDGYFSVSAGGNCFYDNGRKLPSLYGGYYTQSMTDYVAENCVQRALTNDDPEYADGYRYTISRPQYTITFANTDGAGASTQQMVYAGDVPVYGGGTPSKATDSEGTYTFAGWRSASTDELYTGALPMATADETYTAEFNMIPMAARIGDTRYLTLEAAYAAASAGQTITLLRDVAMSGTWNVAKSFTLDLAGNTITATAGRNTDPFINITTPCSVTMMNGSIEAMNYASVFYAYNLWSGSTDVSLTLTDVNINSSITQSPGDVYIVQCDMLGDDLTGSMKGSVAMTRCNLSANWSNIQVSNARGVCLSNPPTYKSVLSMTDCSIKVVANASSRVYGMYLENTSSTSSLTNTNIIAQNTTNATNATAISITNAPTNLYTGGYFSHDVLSQFANKSLYETEAVGSGAPQYAEGYRYHIVVPTYVASVSGGSIVGENMYKTFAEAMTAANATSGATIKLLDDAVVTATNNVNKAMTLDLNGHVLSGSGTLLQPLNGGHLTIMDSQTGGRIESAAAAEWGRAITVAANGKLTLQSGSVVETDPSSKGKNNIYAMVCNANAELVVNGGTVLCTGSQPTILNSGGTVTINGGAVTNNGTGSAVSNYNENVPSFLTTINGGYIRSVGGGADVGRSHGTLEVKGGFFAHTYNDEFSVGSARRTLLSSEPEYAQGYRYEAVPLSQATCTVAYNDKTYGFTQMNDAYNFANARSGSVLTLLQDISGWNGQHVVGRNMTIDLNGHTLSGNNAHCFFNVSASVTLNVTSSQAGGRIVAELQAGSDSNKWPRIINIGATGAIANFSNFAMEFSSPATNYAVYGILLSETGHLNMTNCQFNLSAPIMTASTYMYAVLLQKNSTAVIEDCHLNASSESTTASVFTVDLETANNTLTLRNTDVEAHNMGKAVRPVISNGTLTIDGGSFYAEAKEWSAAVQNGGVATILDGKFKTNSSSFPSVYTSATASTQLKGGFYSTKPNDAEVANGYLVRTLGSSEPEYAEGYRYQVVDLSHAACTVTTSDRTYGFMTLADAVTFANKQTGATLNVLKDLDNVGQNSIIKSMTIDLNGHTITEDGSKTGGGILYVGGSDVEVTITSSQPGAVIREVVSSGGWFAVGTSWANGDMTLRLSNLTIEMTTTAAGASTYAVSTNHANHKLYIDNCTITGTNHATSGNGEVAGVRTSGLLDLRNSTVRGESSNYSAFAVYAYGTPVNQTIDNCHLEVLSAAGSAWGVANYGGDIALNQTTISVVSTSTSAAGSICIVRDARANSDRTVTITDCEMTATSIAQELRGLLIYQGNFTLTNTNIDVHSTGALAYALDASNGGTYNITDCNFSATTDVKYGMAISSSSNLTINGGTYKGSAPKDMMGYGVLTRTGAVSTTILAGKFTGTQGAYADWGSPNLKALRGGYYSTWPADGAIADGYKRRTLLSSESKYAEGYRYEVVPNDGYVIVFQDQNGNVLQYSVEQEDATPEYTGATPTKESTAQYDYTFSGWTPAIAPVTGDATYTATYDATVRSYTITWVNEDGTSILDEQVLSYGATPVFAGVEPTKKDYTFDGWSPEIQPVTGSATYTAIFTAIPPVAEVIPSGEISGTGYTVWAEAVDAANASAGCTLRLLDDVTGVAASTVLTNTLTLDLNGHELSGTANNLIMVNAASKTVTITDNSAEKDGRISMVSNAATRTATVYISNGTLNVTEGTIYAENTCSHRISTQKRAVGIYNNGKTLNISGGTISAYSPDSYALGVNTKGGTVNITGGTITAHADSARVYGVYNDSTAATVNIENATIRATMDAKGTTAAAKTYAYGVYMAKSSGKLNIKSGADILAECTATYGQYTYGVNTVSGVTAQIYDGATITANSKYTTVYGLASAGTTTIYGGTITAQSTTSTVYGVYVSNKTTTIEGGTISAQGSKTVVGVCAYATTSSSTGAATVGTLIVNGGNVTAQSTATSSAATYAAQAVASGRVLSEVGYVAAATLTINGGNFVVNGKATSAYTVYSTGVVTKGERSIAPTLAINGGHFKAMDKANVCVKVGAETSLTENFTITGGYYSLDTNLATYVVDGKSVMENTDEPERSNGYLYKVDLAEFGVEMDIVDWGTNSVTLNMNGYGANSGKWGVKNASDVMLRSTDREDDRTLAVSTEALTPNSDLRINVYGDAETESPVLESSRTYRVPYIYTSSTTLSEAISDAEAVLYVKSGTLTVDANVTVTKVVVCPGAGLVVASGKTLTTEDLVLRGKVWEYEQPKLTIDGSLTVNGQSYYTRIIADKTAYYPFALPFASNVNDVRLSTGQTLTFGEDKNWNLKYYDGAKRANGQEAWTNHAGGAITANTYYIMGSGSAYYREFYFPITLGAATTSLSVSEFASASAANAGWNGLGSPFTGVYHQRFSEPSEAVKITTKNEDNSTWWQHVAEDIYPFFPFFYQSSASGTLNFGSELTFRAPASVAARAKDESDQQNVRTQWVQLLLTNARGETDETSLYVHPSKFTADYDSRYDLSKMLGDGVRPQLYTRMACGNLAFNALPDSVATTRIPVEVLPGDAKTLTFRLGTDEYLDRTEAIYLIDEALGTTTNLLYSDYEWSTEDGLQNRFYLSIGLQKNSDTTTGINGISNTAGEGIKKVIYDNKLYILVGNEVYDATGKKVQ